MVVGDFTTEVDVLVIGSGPGGYVAAIRAAKLGKKVTIVERAEIGGVCLNRGCIPSKALISAAHQYESISQASRFGIEVEGVKVNFAKIQEWKNGIVQKLNGGVDNLLKGSKVEIVTGEALFINEREVRIINGYESSRLRFNHCILATGSRPIELPSLPYGGRVLSSTEALQLQEIPKRLIVVGGGYIGIELTQVFAKFGTKVTILEGSDSILPGFDARLVSMVKRNLKKSHVEVFTNAFAQVVEEKDGEVTVIFKQKEHEQKVSADYVLVTVGRKPNTDELGLDAIGMKLDKRGLIEIDHQCRTNVPNIYAIGDIVAGPALAHKASYEGKVAAEVIAGKSSTIDYRAIPAVVFSDPEIALVGITEKEAKDQGYETITGRFSYAANGRALALNATEGNVTLLADKKFGLILGAQIVGHEASNLIAEIGLAIEMGTTLEDIALTIHAHPTLGEMVMEAAEDALGLSTHTL